jgi:Rod binding domain-containing protein
MVQATQTSTTITAPSAKDRSLHKAAQALEASFLAEMLKAAGLGKTSGQFGGGQGEDQFASFLVQEQAKQMVEAGGIGLAEALFESLKEKSDAGS